MDGEKREKVWAVWGGGGDGEKMKPVRFFQKIKKNNHKRQKKKRPLDPIYVYTLPTHTEKEKKNAGEKNEKSTIDRERKKERLTYSAV